MKCKHIDASLTDKKKFQQENHSARKWIAYHPKLLCSLDLRCPSFERGVGSGGDDDRSKD